MSSSRPSKSLENYPSDIVARVLAEYPPDAVGFVHLRLEELFSDRLVRCALYLAKGSMGSLESAVALAREDDRDLIVAAEYDSFRIRLRDFSRPFGEENIPDPLG